MPPKLTMDEARAIYKAINLAIAAKNRPGGYYSDRTWKAVAEGLDVELARLEFARLTDEQIGEGVRAFVDSVVFRKEPEAEWPAAFRKAVAEARKTQK